ncbi:hypothetical protein H0H92_002130 [Tricholoma furcatifolium]|nr:hypothetical protein H0H92_002130 [Tricholoma furcatifolium]
MIPLNPNTLLVAGVVSFYMFAALILLIAVVLLHVSALFSKRIEIPKFTVETAIKLVPVVLVNIVGLVFNTLCLRGVEASFFQIARGLVLPLTILVSFLHMRATPSKQVLLAASTVTFGFFIGVAPSTSLPAASTPSVLSLVYGILSSLFIALHAVLIKSSLPHCHNSTIQLAWWTNFGSAVFLFPAVLLHGEATLFYSNVNDPSWNGTVFIWGSLITGFFGFLLCIAGLLSIKVTSPITHMFSSAARSVLQTLLGVWIFNDILTVSRGTSILVILGGTMFYTWIKAQVPPPPPRRSMDVEATGAESVSLNPSTETKEGHEKN